MKSAHDRVVASLVFEHHFGVIHRKGGGEVAMDRIMEYRYNKGVIYKEYSIK